MNTILTGLRSNNDLHLGNYLGAILPMVNLQKSLGSEDQLFMFVPDLHSFTTPVDHDSLYENSLENVRVFMAAGIDSRNEQSILYRQSQISAHSELTVILSNFVNVGELSRMTQFKSKANRTTEAKITSFLANSALGRLLSNPESSVNNVQIKAKEHPIKNLEDFNRRLVKLGNKELADELNSISEDTANEFIKTYNEQIELYNEIKELRVPDEASAGLLNYPILMAADILLYSADYIPLGDDQKQHMELTRTIAQRMNERFGDIFNVPRSWKQQLEFSKREHSVRIKSLAHPENKMSKSIDDPRGTILLTDTPDEARKKIMSAQTDNEGSVKYDFDKQPGVANLIQIGALLEGKSVDEVASEWNGSNEYGKLKEYVAEVTGAFLEDFSQRLSQIELSDAEKVLERGEKQANMIAQKKLEEVQKAVGLRR